MATQPLFDMSKAQPLTPADPNSASPVSAPSPGSVQTPTATAPALFDMSKAQPIAGAATDNTGQPSGWDRFLQTSPIQGLINTAKSSFDSSRQQAEDEQTAQKTAIGLIKSGDYGRALETLLGQVAKTAAPPGVVQGLSSLANVGKSSIQHGKAAYQAASQGNVGEAIAQGAEAVPVLGQVAEQIGEPLGKDAHDEFHKNGKWSAGDPNDPAANRMLGDIAGGATSAATALIGGGAAEDLLSPEAAEEGSAAASEPATPSPATPATPATPKVPRTPLLDKIRPESVQPEVQGNIRNAMNTVADEAEVPRSTSKSIAKTPEDAADAIMEKSKGQYKVLDEASGGTWQRFSDSIKNVQKQMRNIEGIDDDQYEKLELKQNDLQTLQANLIDKLKSEGKIDPALADEAKTNYKKSQALYDLDTNLRRARTGASPDVVDAKAAAQNPEIIDPEKGFKAIDKLHASGRLQDALGEKGADDLYRKMNDSVIKYRKIVNTQGAVKSVGGKVGHYAGYGAGTLGVGLGLKALYNGIFGND